MHFYHLSTRLVSTGVLCLACCLPGCSSSSGYDQPEKLVPVTGTVLLDGAPLGGASINFVPQAGTAGLGGFAITDSSGKFDALHISNVLGLPSGSYAVTFSKLAMPDGSPIPPDLDAADAGALQVLPRHLTEVFPEQHPFMLTVTTDPQTVTYQLQSKRGR